MAKRDSEYLLDITTTLALFVEGIKLAQQREFNTVLFEVSDELRRLFAKVDHKTLDGLTKAELNRLLGALRKSQARIYSAYVGKLVQSLETFMQVRLEVSAVAYASAKRSFIKPNEPFTQLSEDKAFDFIEAQSAEETFSPLHGLAPILPSGKPSLWSTIKNAAIPANGLLLLPFINSFSRSAQASVENTVRKAYANRQTVAETLEEIAGKPAKQGNSTQLAKVKRQADTVIETAFAHVDQTVMQALVSAIFAHYQWVSVLDGNTTLICRERDNKVFRFGQGPVPPAHYKCRSITVPLASMLDDFNPPTLYAWLKKQPPETQDEFLGKETAALLRSGKITAKDFADLPVSKPLSIAQLKQKLKLILNRPTR